MKQLRYCLLGMKAYKWRQESSVPVRELVCNTPAPILSRFGECLLIARGGEPDWKFVRVDLETEMDRGFSECAIDQLGVEFG